MFQMDFTAPCNNDIYSICCKDMSAYKGFKNVLQFSLSYKETLLQFHALDLVSRVLLDFLLD